MSPPGKGTVVGPMLDDDLMLDAQVGKMVGGFSPYDQLSDQRKIVVDHYVMDPTSFNDAVRAAGYSKLRIFQKTWELYHDPKMQAAIAEKMNDRIERTMITQDRILQELAIIGFSDLRNYSINPQTGNLSLPSGVPEYVMRAVSSIKFITVIDEAGHERRTLEFKLWDKPGALRMMGQHLAMFTENLNINGEIDVRQKWSIGGKEIVF